VTTGQPKRQERGLQRIEQILDAAARVFAAAGYEGTTTNAIAAAAKMSPGSLYQFFRNKEAIAEALAERYVTQLEAAYAVALDPHTDATSIDAWVGQVVDPLVAFYVSNPSFKTLLHEADVSPKLADSTHALHATVLARIEEGIAARVPSVSARERTRAAQVSVQIFIGLMPMVLAAKPAERRAVVKELKTALSGYLGGLS
jgi:AcrR family transcriptional regulator